MHSLYQAGLGDLCLQPCLGIMSMHLSLYFHVPHY